MSVTNNKIRKISKKVLLTVKVMKILCYVSMAGCLTAPIILPMFRNELHQSMVAYWNSMLNQGYYSSWLLGIVILFGGSYAQFLHNILNRLLADLPGRQYLLDIMKVILIALICLILVVAILHYVGKIFQSFMESDTPFYPEIKKDLKKLFILLFLPALDASISFGIILGFTLFCIYQIFMYGCELQRQSDETL